MAEREHLLLAGGGTFEPQQQIAIPEVHVEVVQPPQDNTLLWMSGVVVPLVIALVGWWLHHRKKKNETG